MTAEDQGPIRLSAKSRPGVAGGIQVVLHWQFRQLALEPGPRLEPRRTPGDALRPMIIRGERTKLLKVRDRSASVDWHVVSLRSNLPSASPNAKERAAITWGVHLSVNPPVLPMLAKRVAELPVGDTWIFEPKWDGFRALVFRDGDEILIQSRDQKSLNRYFPELVETLLSQLPARCVLDGEIVIASESGLEFEVLQLRIHPAASRVKLLSQQTPASIVFFDLLCEGDREPVRRTVPRTAKAIGICARRRGAARPRHPGNQRSDCGVGLVSPFRGRRSRRGDRQADGRHL